MSLVIKGKLHKKYDAVQVSEKFKKREFILELGEEVNGNIYTNYAKLQLVQAKCDILDRFNEADMVIVDFNIKGNSYVDKKDGATKYITNLDAWRIVADQQFQSRPASAPVAGPANNAGSFNPSPETIDDLPF